VIVLRSTELVALLQPAQTPHRTADTTVARRSIIILHFNGAEMFPSSYTNTYAKSRVTLALRRGRVSRIPLWLQGALVGRDFLSDFVRTFRAVRQSTAAAAVTQQGRSRYHGYRCPCSTPVGASFAAARVSRVGHRRTSGVIVA